MTDLDARVAALLPCPFCGREPKLLDLAGWEVQCDCGVNMCLASPEQAAVIKAWNQRVELQKPALHEPVTSEEVQTAVLMAERDNLSMREVLESFLQGRVKPAPIARINVTEAGWTQALVNGICVASSYGQGEYVYDIVRKINAGALGVESAQPAQEEITDEQWLGIAEAHANLDWDSRKPDGFLNAVISVGKAAIRAGKGEKT